MNRTTLHLLFALILCTLLAVGCAKKPASVVVDPAAGSTSTLSSDQVAGYGSGSVGDQAVGDRYGAGSGFGADVSSANLQRIYFDFDQFTLSSDARDTLARNAEYLKANPSLQVRIEGHCDERGSDEYNLALGERRALATKNYLVQLGINPSRLATISYGEEMPLDPGQGETAWSKNRRAEFKEAR